MAEAGGPAMAEVQPKPVGVVEKVQQKLRELLTPQGRAEAMADKQIKTILERVAPEDRVKAMEMLEAKRPDLVAASLPGAKDRLVKEAVVGAAALGVLAVGGGVAIAKRDAIMDAAFSIGIPKVKGDQAPFPARRHYIDSNKANFVASIRRATVDPVKGFMEGMSNRFNRSRAKGEMPINLGKMFKDIEDKALDLLNVSHPVEKFVELSDELIDHVASRLGTDYERSLSNNFLTHAQKNKEWVPVIIPKKDGNSGLEDSVSEHYHTMVKKGFAVVKNLADGTVLISPTKRFVEFVRSNANLNKS